MKRSFYLLSMLAAVMVCAVNGFAQQPNTKSEEIVLTTYYPAPYGDFQNLRLWPSKQKPCTEDKRGILYYDETDNKVMVCTLSGDGATYAWQVLGEELWSHNKNTNTVYANNTELNAGNRNAGIGTAIARAYDNRQTKLDVGDNVRGNADGYVAVDDVYLKDPVSGPPGWLSQAGDLATPVNGQCPPGYSKLLPNDYTTFSIDQCQQSIDWTNAYPSLCYTCSRSFICIKTEKIGGETYPGGCTTLYPTY
jgi:hypothetical protein